MKPIVALDADGVLLDYNLAYRHAWEKAFGVLPELRDLQAYWPMDRWNVRQLQGDELHHFRKSFDAEFWSSIPAIPGAIEACTALTKAGYQLVCVTALETEYAEARTMNLCNLGFPIDRIVTTGKLSGTRSPKADTVNDLNPVAFVDDYLPFFNGVDKAIHKALITREPNGSPNCGDELLTVTSAHQNLENFASAWLNLLMQGMSTPIVK